MANARGKSIDNTHLSIDTAEERGFIHRDYIAHCFRWSHVVKYLMQKKRYQDAVIVDIGCGKELPLAKLLYSNKMTGGTYIGVDINKLETKFNFGKMADNIKLYGQTDFCNLNFGEPTKPEGCTDWGRHVKQQPNVITCFEVLEHVEPEHTVRILKKIREVITDDGVAFISTPCFNGKAAGNHVNEITFEALGTLILELGFDIERVHGTFASQRDLEPELESYLEDSSFSYIYNGLLRYYDSNVISTFLAPLFPASSRNALWVLRKSGPGVSRTGCDFFRDWDQLATPWTSSDKWKELRP